MTPDLHIHFSEITKLIRQAGYETLKKIKTDLIKLKLSTLLRESPYSYILKPF